ncbi:uncharacterized protein I303_108395 [Kwoniella dejecticola CBS 10117]|uniref:Coenzyme Q-binding protein COQ10 START domain-containing protein n=1 Tax=Kwoniella dejecticola CBS 10117 TaxID=1296121 RepID=A0A1A5ZXI7_9TREE|nr:uncharacterized protein I303_07278 [Kwoniella dejecticola CBS 10117]OBR82518.1 hypothetical protein I303_07278 [Kwoniella dejecticola CBS 10117]
MSFPISTIPRSILRSTANHTHIQTRCVSSIPTHRSFRPVGVGLRHTTILSQNDHTITSINSHTHIRIRSQNRSFFSLPDITKLANLVPGQQQSDSGGSPTTTTTTSESGVVSGIEVDGEAQRFHARKILPYSQTQLYSLVSDVPSYSSFIPFCNSSTVLPRPASNSKSTSSSNASTTRQWNDWTPGEEPFEVLAELAVGFGGLEERYISKVVGIPFESVTATASNQTPLFKSLITRWSFSPASTFSPHPTSPPSPPLSASSTESSSSSDPTSSREPNSTSPADPNIGPTLLTIDLNFNFANPLHRIASQAVLPKVADKMVYAFEKRCLEVYGKGTQ